MSIERTFGKVLTGLLLVSLSRAAESKNQVFQPPLVVSSEGALVEIPCNHSVSNAYYFYWYKHYLGSAPSLLISGSKATQKERYNMTYTRLSSSLVIHQMQREDAAVYYCAVANTGTQVLIFGKGTRLVVFPNIKDPQPALYQLTSPKSSDTSVCLLTDFDSSNTYTNGNDSTVLEMMTMESKSYGAVAWGSKSSFNCTNAFPQNIINLTQPSGSTCKVQDVEQSFETDKDLNLMNASLIFLRVIFLKTVGFNLLMTLRLWSN